MWVAQVSILRPGFLLGNGSWPQHPGLKIETWATHLLFVRSLVVFLRWPQAHGSAPRDLQCAFTLESTDEWTVSRQDRCGHGCRAGHWTSNRNCICGRRSHGVGY